MVRGDVGRQAGAIVGVQRVEVSREVTRGALGAPGGEGVVVGVPDRRAHRVQARQHADQRPAQAGVRAVVQVGDARGRSQRPGGDHDRRVGLAGAEDLGGAELEQRAQAGGAGGVARRARRAVPAQRVQDAVR